MIYARLKKAFPQRRDSAAFKLDIELKASRGITVLFGPSGSGKTLSLDSIAGFVRPDDGRILIDDEILFDGPTGVNLPPQARQCGYVFQNYALFPHMTLRENLMFAAERRPRLERRRKVKEALERFHLTEVAGRRPREVSGGQKQRCSIARALIGAPKALLLDEPARGLDAPLRAELYEVLHQVRSEFQVPILVVTHQLEECFELGDHMVVIRDGCVVQAGPPRAVADKPANVETARLLGIYNVLPAELSELNPQKNSSRLRLWDCELTGPYFPGHFKGDRVWMCVRPEALTVSARDGRLGPNQVPAEFVRAVDMPGGMRLEFAGGLSVTVARDEYERQKHNREWVVSFPEQELRVL